MPLEVTYFNGKGAAELTRLLFALAEKEFKDTRIERANWPQLKPNTPLGSMPIITLENGKKYAQSAAIARYVANKLGLAGNNDEEKLHADMVVETLKTDILPAFMKVMFSDESEEKKKEMHAKATSSAKDFLKHLNDKYVYGSNTVLASGVSWADVAIFNLFHDMVPMVKADGEIKIDDFANLKKVYEHVGGKLDKYVKSRPETQF